MTSLRLKKNITIKYQNFQLDDECSTFRNMTEILKILNINKYQLKNLTNQAEQWTEKHASTLKHIIFNEKSAIIFFFFFFFDSYSIQHPLWAYAVSYHWWAINIISVQDQHTYVQWFQNKSNFQHFNRCNSMNALQQKMLWTDMCQKDQHIFHSHIN